MIWFIVSVVTYLVVGLYFARNSTFENEQPGDRFKAFLMWPVLFVYICWMVWTKKWNVRRR